jgi:hypothetical protein
MWGLRSPALRGRLNKMGCAQERSLPPSHYPMVSPIEWQVLTFGFLAIVR